MTLDILTIEVGSTITKVNGFRREDGALTHVAQGFAPTSVEQGDVGVGVQQAIADLTERFGEALGEPETFVNSSAAGGLRMTVHGLTQSMTARAAREASLGAGAIVELVTAGRLSEDDLADIADVHPNIILLAGGVDFGEKDTVVANAQALASLGLPVPVVYAGNVAARRAVERAFREADVELLEADNVFPEVDTLNVEPLRDLIHEVFSRHIIHAPGMAAFADLTPYEIYPTPGAVLLAAELFAEVAGDVLVVDVGGATTDVHSVTDGTMEWSTKIVDPEPRSKRTVEGDLGVYVNAANVIKTVRGAEADLWRARMADLEAMPHTDASIALTRWLTEHAVQQGVRRHAGVVSEMYTPGGRKQIVKGKDLTGVSWIVATGGALTRVEGGEKTLHSIAVGAGRHLMPPPEARVLVDRDYLFSALGTLAQRYPDEVRETFARWVAREQ